MLSGDFTPEQYEAGFRWMRGSRILPTPAEVQHQLAALAESWEPEASAAPPARRLSKCAACARRMLFPWHFWLEAGGFKKELHVCNGCVRKRGWA